MGQAQRNQNAKINQLVKMGRKQGYDEGCWVGALNAAIIMLYVMHDEFGYGKKRLKRIYNRISDLTNTYMVDTEGEEQVYVTELAEVLKEECGIELDAKTALLHFPKIESEPGYEIFRLK